MVVIGSGRGGRAFAADGRGPATISRQAWEVLQRHDVALLLAIVIVMSAIHLLGEKIQVGGGLGWDGVLYGRIAMDFDDMVLRRGYVKYIEPGYDSIVFQRLGPSVVIHLFLRPFFDPIDMPTVIRAFTVGNIATTVATCWLVLSALRRHGVGQTGRWVATVGLLLNFCMLKWLTFYPVLTDSYGILLGAWMVHAYMARRSWQILLATALATVTWPADFLLGMVLLLFGGPVDAPTRLAWLDDTRLTRGVSAAVSIAYAIIAGFLLLPEQYGNNPFSTQPALTLLAPVSVLIGAAYVYFGLRWLLNDSLAGIVHAILSMPRRPMPYLSIAVVSAIYLVQRSRLPSSASGSPELTVYEHMIQSGVMRPAMFAIGHIVFFGPAIILAALYWPSICRIASRLGPGLVVGLAVMLALTLGSESRRVANFLPLLVVPLGAAVDVDGWRWRDVLGFGVLSVLTSKVWLQIGVWYDPSYLNPRLFMNFGPWMQLDAYLLQGGIGLAIAALLTFAYIRIRASRISQLREGSTSPIMSA